MRHRKTCVFILTRLSNLPLSNGSIRQILHPHPPRLKFSKKIQTIRVQPIDSNLRLQFPCAEHWNYETSPNNGKCRQISEKLPCGITIAQNFFAPQEVCQDLFDPKSCLSSSGGSGVPISDLLIFVTTTNCAANPSTQPLSGYCTLGVDGRPTSLRADICSSNLVNMFFFARNLS